jgi:hypothetical protein
MDLKKILRIVGLVFMILLALSGIGLIPPRPTRDYDSEIKIEMVEEREEDAITSVDSSKEIKS